MRAPGQLQFLDMGPQCGAEARDDPIRATVRPLDHDVVAVDDIAVIARPALQPVAAAPAGQAVVTGAAQQGVGPRAPVQTVIAAIARQLVIAPVARQPVVADAAEHPVVAIAPGHRVVARQPGHQVGEAGADQIVGPPGAADRAVDDRRQTGRGLRDRGQRTGERRSDPQIKALAVFQHHVARHPDGHLDPGLARLKC